MRRISSNIFIAKRIFPFVTIAAVLVMPYVVGGRPIWRDSFAWLLAFQALCVGLVLFVYHELVWDMADEVLLAEGDVLVVRFGKESESIPLSDITDIKAFWEGHPNRLVISLRSVRQVSHIC